MVVGYDSYIVKFNSSGTRLWGSHFGGNDVDLAYDCETDLLGNIYMSGKTASTNSVATTGSHQLTNGGGTHDAFLVSFNATTGTRKLGELIMAEVVMKKAGDVQYTNQDI
ncbi:MAG: hypothetical protein IPG08_08495 [Sphingobacteriaceae bacterium]|nr:hypothetical protein [Sphingobacteriaceae bacterium]